MIEGSASEPEAIDDVPPLARVEPSRRRAIIWLVPLLALCVVAGLVLQQWWSRGPMITIAIPRATGIESGRTPVLSQGVPIGIVERVRLAGERRQPVVDVRLERWAGDFAREGSVYWVVRPSIGFRGVSGLETLASGPVLEALAGPRSGPRASTFEALARPPADAASGAGLRIVLNAPRLGSVRPGTPVTYREVQVGEVIDARLASDSRGVEIDLLIGVRFAPLVREGSRFWNTSGFGVDLGMTGVKFRTESIEAMLGGGIAFATPSATSAAAPDGARYSLASEPEKEWLRWEPAIDLGS